MTILFFLYFMYMESFNSCFIIRFVIIIEKEIDSFEYFIKGYEV